MNLSSENHHQLWVPPGFAHGFVVFSESAEFLYKTTDHWNHENEQSLLWNDPIVAINRRINFVPQLVVKDAAGKTLAETDSFD